MANSGIGHFFVCVAAVLLLWIFMQIGFHTIHVSNGGLETEVLKCNI